ncbi:GUN4 domain-containing protein [Gloeocapsa sp. PCC 73106]|uniref:GUN4 domain-containing protein n=1 Tax=Gloeocapsa sp. PCC 73106 TaxID=102232 RepID=UPI0002AC8C97|nr:GUN4 domain-containing protein [Gloeocapsa sp. PCC 73106]ELR98774.1 GUN4 [Gloeocapsa sp. PCC 73106]
MSEQDYSERISQLEQRITSLEQKLTLVADVERYQKLQELVITQQIKAADLETKRLIMEITAKDQEDALTPEDILQFPCNALKIIDQIWVNNTQELFGYSVQLDIYRSVGGSADTLQTQDIEVFKLYGDRVGWRVDNEWQGDNYDQWNFTPEAPKGCFPAASWNTAYGLKMITYFFTRLLNCNI